MFPACRSAPLPMTNPSAQPPVYVGVDLGTSSLKVIAVDADGTTRGQARSAYETFRPGPGAAEQESADWLAALRAALLSLGGQIPVSAWRGIGLTGMIPTLVTLDAAGRPLGRAVTWQDDRAARCGDALHADVPDLYARTGQWVDGRYLLPMAAAARGRDPRLEAGTTLAGAKDFLFARLAGELLTDPSTAAGYGCYDLAAGRWIGELTSDWALPTVAPATAVRPAIDAAAAAFGVPAGLPIVLGAADSVLGVDAAGVTGPDDVAYLTGSSTIMLRRAPAPIPDAAHRYLITPMADGGFGAEMDLLATGSAVAWMTGILGSAGGRAGTDTAGAEAGADADTSGAGAGAGDADPFRPGLPLMLPYVAPGEQGALWDDALSGTIAGLTLGHTGADLLRALASGVIVESARCLGVFGAAFGPVRGIRAGGAGLSARTAQELADAAGSPVSVLTPCPTYSGYGAAQLAARAIDGAGIPPVAALFTADPDDARHLRWAAVAGRHDDLRRRLDGWSGR